MSKRVRIPGDAYGPSDKYTERLKKAAKLTDQENTHKERVKLYGSPTALGPRASLMGLPTNILMKILEGDRVWEYFFAVRMVCRRLWALIPPRPYYNLPSFPSRILVMRDCESESLVEWVRTISWKRIYS